MPSLLLPPRRTFLVDQVTEVLRREIAAGRWREWLPGERCLIKTLNVSRPTLRGALQQLVEVRELVRYPRHGYRLGRAAGRGCGPQSAAATELGLICPERIYSMPAYVIQVVDLLRALAAEAGLHLELFEGRRFARTDPGRFMPALVRRHPKACWIPLLADRRMQEWFAHSGTPAVLYGNIYPDLPLSGVGVDYRACLQHATSLLLARGHRRIALVSYDPRRAGEQESLAGFREAFRRGDHEGTAAFELARPDDDVAALRRQVDRLLDLAQPPTAFIVCRTHHYATVATRIVERGRRVPRDVSLVCRGEDTFLHFLCPTPAFYRVNLELLARRLFRSVLRVTDGGPQAADQHRVVPQFVPGASVGAAPAGDP